MPASEVLDCTASALPPRAGSTTRFCSVVLPDPEPPVSHTEGLQASAPQIGAMAIHPASNVPETGRSQAKRVQICTSRLASAVAIGGADGIGRGLAAS